MRPVVEQFIQAGFARANALEKSAMLGKCISLVGGREPAFAFYVPGRVEVLGKHTDYAGGRSLVAAVDRGFVVAVNPRNDSHVVAHACDYQQRAGFDYSAQLRPTPGGWSNYVMSVAQRLARNFGEPLKGMDFAFASDLPAAAGMSSSSALVVATYLAFNAVNRFDEREVYRNSIKSVEDLAGYLGSCENGQGYGALAGASGVGTCGGSQDHTAILCSRPGELGIFTYAPVRLERRVAFPEDMRFVIGVSGVVAEKTAGAMQRFNRVSALAKGVMEVLQAAGWTKPTLAAAIGDDREAAECVRQVIAKSRHSQFKPAELLARFEQFVAEHQRNIPAAVDALGRRDWGAFGRAVASSQSMAETNLGNQVPQTIAMVLMARQKGAVAASAFGAGFGGSVWAMVPAGEAEEFARDWEEEYRAAFPEEGKRARCFVVGVGGGAMQLL